MPKMGVSQHVNANIAFARPHRAEMGSHPISGMRVVSLIGTKGVKRFLAFPVVQPHT